MKFTISVVASPMHRVMSEGALHYLPSVSPEAQLRERQYQPVEVRIILHRISSSMLIAWACTAALSTPAGAQDVEPTKLRIPPVIEPWKNHQRLDAQSLLLLYNANLPESRELAEYYAEKRQVPAAHLLGLNAPWPAEEITAADFETEFRQPIRAYLEARRMTENVRCLVTFYGLPLRIRDVRLGPREAERFTKLTDLLRDRIDALERAVHELKHIDADAPPELSPRRPDPKDFNRIVNVYRPIRAQRWQRVQESGSDPEVAETARRIHGLIRRIEGVSGILSLAETDDPEQAKQLEAMAEKIQARRGEAQRLIDVGPDLETREQAYTILEETDGLVGAIRLIESDRSLLNPEDSVAAVDNELMLLWWDDYPKSGFLPSPMCWRVRQQPQLLLQIPLKHWTSRLVMAARLDASSPDIVRRMIDDALAAEVRGLTGNIYFDAQGKSGPGRGAYDQNLRDLGDLLRRETTLQVRTDNRKAVFGPGDCPNTMLYCGWYSLRKYVDAFTFETGAFAWHIASFEAISLKEPNERGWCKNLLDDGACATMGSVAEPYLQSFPLPKDFFGMLMTGRFTLAECYAYTAHFVSWRQLLLGDPLYRPFAKNPQLAIEDVFPGMVAEKPQ